MSTPRENKLALVNQIIDDLQAIGATEIGSEGSEDSAEDLNDTELDLLLDQLLTKAARPRKIIGTI